MQGKILQKQCTELLRWQGLIDALLVFEGVYDVLKYEFLSAKDIADSDLE